jgi:hypothetical protein
VLDEPEVPVLIPLAALFTGEPVKVVAAVLEFGCCGRTAERSSICRRWRLGAALSILFCSTVEFTALGGADELPFVIS